MAMMMTGRVLLVCALCVLWCGAGGGFGEEAPTVSVPDLPTADTVAQGITEMTGDAGNGGPQDGKEKLQGETKPEVNVNNSENPAGTPSGVNAEEEEDDKEETEEEEEIRDEHNVETEPRKDQGEEAEDGPGVPNARPVASAQQHLQPAPSTGSKSPSGSLETTLQATQTGLQQSADTPNNLPTGNNKINKETGRKTASDKTAEETSPSSLREGVVDIQKDAEGNNEKHQNNPHLPATAATLQVHQQDGKLDTINETILSGETNNENIQQNDSSSKSVKAVQSDAGTEGNPTANELSRPSIEDATPISKTHDFNKDSDSTENVASETAGSVTAPNTDSKPGGTAMPGDSDSSTAVSHTTSPLLLLLVACAAAAVVAA
ncbi:mucin-associated surface protein (MASP) [Trypanosoma cruzi]|uniref:Mucin-associated surface protein (MASP), putative n=1 Tax=Trypanosoma cruzi (strain CL Brener) TaxID=353153 RepID=Q4DT36_TRYCC|nr:mucin-associated surface protein (MASP), putative [Trypanosoma cruzi]EAN95680.1 mucin-associated surface protein (MASP), putative [Trypanosoma cruzi]RNC44302.1 mucin-associated surface protein (MASP) [Trypanosoma cruzi]|eukprot:XP_817531.1 mucin-associated surface protein (MASP) [Trypanosoma cruzi strain CL Brener]